MPVIFSNPQFPLQCICGKENCAFTGRCHCGCGKETGIASKNRNECGWIKGRHKRFIWGHQIVLSGKKANPREPNVFVIHEGESCVWISLTKGKWALVAQEDYDLVKDIPWHESHGYACWDSGSGRVFMHQVICPTTGLMVPDHRNGKRWDNRRSNLRPATRRQNMQNCKLQKNNTSGFKGVNLHHTGKWRARIESDHLGLFNTKEEAVAARMKAEKERFGEFGGRYLCQ